ncbi:hypothetical protein [Thioalkalivibrio sp. ALJ2]|uniref:hypothetical protein n=1 Tax=Thioalkalivibrio sp. ALJ2 TaxID=1261622 RepID=UPI001E55A7F9|nr:hypothetical protein [Thioalkalivibrio sp. ALJ2]
MFVPGGHHFLVTREGTDCNEAMTRFSSEHVAHEMYDADSADNPNNPFYDNPAGLVCTTRPTCGAVTQTRTTFRTRMSGFLDAGSNVSTADARMSGGSLECQTFGRLGGGDGSGAYWCPVTDPMRSSAQGVVGAASGSGVEVDELWGYRIERGDQGELIEKRAGRSASSLNIEKTLDFNSFGFALAARGSGDDDDDDNDGDPPPSGSECTTVVQGNLRNSNQNVSVALPTSGGTCSQTGNTYSCFIEAAEGETFELEASGPGNQLSDFRGETNCDTINYSF